MRRGVVKQFWAWSHQRTLGVNCLYTNSNYLHVFLLCREHDPCSLPLGAMLSGMDIFIGCGYGSHTGIAPATLAVYTVANTVQGYKIIPKILSDMPSFDVTDHGGRAGWIVASPSPLFCRCHKGVPTILSIFDDDAGLLDRATGWWNLHYAQSYYVWRTFCVPNYCLYIQGIFFKAFMYIL